MNAISVAAFQDELEKIAAAANPVVDFGRRLGKKAMTRKAKRRVVGALSQGAIDVGSNVTNALTHMGA